MVAHPHNFNFSDGQLGVLILIVLPAMGGLAWLYNAYRLGKLKWKPTGPMNPRRACLVILFGILLTGVLLALVGCGNNKKLLYDKVEADRMEEMFAESYEGVSAVAEGSPETITLNIQNDLEHEIIFWGWSNPYILQNGTWYAISRANPVDSTGPAKEPTPEQIANRTVWPGESKVFTLEFSNVYGAELIPGDYRICATFELAGVFMQDDPSRGLEREMVWAEFTIP